MKTVDLIWLGQRLADMGRVELRAHAAGVPAAELIVMGDLLESSPSTITALADRTGYAQSRVSTAVSGLVKRGWVQTRSDPADGRRTLVFVPEPVLHEAREFKSNAETQSLEQLLVRCSASRRQAIIDALEELLEVLREQAADEHPAISAFASSAEIRS